jgi:hypothetical protein
MEPRREGEETNKKRSLAEGCAGGSGRLSGPDPFTRIRAQRGSRPNLDRIRAQLENWANVVFGQIQQNLFKFGLEFCS